MRWLAALFVMVGCAKSSGPDDAGTDGSLVVDSGEDGGSDAGSDSGSDAGPPLDVCDVPTDCIVVPASCCGSCGQPTRDDVIAVHRDMASQYRQGACGDDASCPACAAPRDPSLIATCNAGRCEVVDVLEHTSGECIEAADCHVRTIDCCECGGDVSMEGLVAISDYTEFSMLVCDPESGCPDCEPEYPADAVPACVEGQCALEWLE